MGGSTTDRSEAVAGVTIDVPEGWRPVAGQADDAVAASELWRPQPDSASGLLLVVGCEGGGVDALVEGVLHLPRGALVVTDAQELTPAPDVPGLEAARRIELTFGAGREDDARTLRTGALYGQAGDALLLIELSAPVASYDQDLVTATLASVRVDADQLRATCEPAAG